MLPKREDKVPDCYQWTDKKFECSLSHRIVFMHNNKFYELKELNDKIKNNQNFQETPIHKNKNI